MESLEKREMLSLIGVHPAYPLLTFDSNGRLAYDAPTQVLSVSATPLALRFQGQIPNTVWAPRDLTMGMKVDNSGNLTGGISGDDLVVTGQIDTNGDGTFDYTGNLLTGEVLQLGYLDGVTTDSFDFILRPTGGALLSYFAGSNMGVTLSSENSSFAGSFTSSFGGGAKGTIGTVPPVGGVALGDHVWEDLNGNGIQDDGNSGINGVTVNLLDGSGSVVGTTVTANDTSNNPGYYLFSGLQPGAYSVQFVAPGGYVFTTPNVDGSATDSNADVITGKTGTYTLIQTDITADAGLYRPVTIGDFVWNDLNANGIQEGGEAGISGVTLTLTGTNGAGVSVTDYATTAANGHYQFTEAPGTYQVAVDAGNYAAGGALVGLLPSPTGQGGNPALDSNPNPSPTSPVTLASGGSDANVDFGDWLPQPGINIVKLTNGSNNDAAPVPGTPDGPVVLVGSTVTWTYDVNNTGNEAIRNVSVTDSASGVTPVYVSGDNGNGQLDPGETWVYAASGIAVAGQYSNIATVTGAAALSGTPLTASNPDHYFGVQAAIDVEKYVKVVQPSCGCTCSNPGSNDYGVDADTAPGPVASAGSQILFTYIVTNPGQVALGNVTLVDDNGTSVFNPAPVTTTFNNTTYNVGDLNHDGLLDVGESWVYTSTAVATAGQHSDTATVTGTPVGGNSSVTDSDAGNYLGTLVAGINIEKYVKVTDSCSGAGGQTGDYWQGGCFKDWSGCGSGGSSYWGRCVQDGWTYYGNCGGQGGTYGGQSAGLSGVVGSKITFTYVVTNTTKTPLGHIIVVDDNGTPADSSDDFVPTAVTTSGGYNVGDVNHNSLLDLGEVWKYTYSTVIASVGQHSNTGKVTGTPVDATGKIVLGSNVADQDAAYWLGVAPKPGSLSGRVFVDGDNDGKADCSEAGITKVTIQLIDASGNVAATTQTGKDGSYAFANVAPGTYTIRELQPAGYVDGKDCVGSLGGKLGNDVLSNIVVCSGNNGSGYNFGELKYASLEGSVYVDSDNDGRIDCGEKGLAGITITLTGKTDAGVLVTLTTTTDAYGHYYFGDLAAGVYTLTEVQPTGYTDGKDSVGDRGGSLSNDKVSNIDLNWCDDADGYNFAELLKKTGCR